MRLYWAGHGRRDRRDFRRENENEEVFMIGELVAGRYRLVEQIGEGATGTVYRAMSEPQSEAVAIKVMRRQNGSAAAAGEGARRFEREAVAAGKLEHPNLVSMRDFGALDDGRPYLVMDLIAGRSLADVMAEEHELPQARALAILADLLRGLGHAHANSVVHRDLKPADIFLVDPEGRAVIADFGSSALTGAAGATAEQLTTAGAGPGTPAYMAPERLDPDHGPVDGRADLYSATCILFEMLSGQPPYGATGSVEPQTLLARHAGTPVPALADEVAEPDSRPALDAIVARGLAKNPAERFASAGEYLTAVEALREGRLDPAMVGKTAAPAGVLAEPDPNKATTVFHGVPAPDAPRATGAQRAAESSGDPREGGAGGETGSSGSGDGSGAGDGGDDGGDGAPGDGANSSGAASGSGTGPRRKWRFAAIGGGAAALILVAALSVWGFGSSRRDDGSEPIGDPMAGLVDAWRAEQLDPGEFSAVPGDEYGGGECRRGTVSRVDVVVCQHRSAGLALKARRTGLRAMKGVARSAVPAGARLLLAASSTRESSRELSKVASAFQKVARPKKNGKSPSSGKDPAPGK
jgi:uncharacterized membrane protein YgcG